MVPVAETILRSWNFLMYLLMLFEVAVFVWTPETCRRANFTGLLMAFIQTFSAHEVLRSMGDSLHLSCLVTAICIAITVTVKPCIALLYVLQTNGPVLIARTLLVLPLYEKTQ